MVEPRVISREEHTLSRRDIDQLAREHGSVTLVKIDSPECDLDVWVGPEAED